MERAASELPSPSRGSERGSALVWALFFVSLTVGILVAHSLEMSANRKTMDTDREFAHLRTQLLEPTPP